MKRGVQINDDFRDMIKSIRGKDEVNVYILHDVDEPHILRETLHSLFDVACFSFLIMIYIDNIACFSFLSNIYKVLKIYIFL